MCGIAGIVDWRGITPDIGRLRRMTDSIRHRGPDGEGHHVRGSVALGHRRLSIIDIATGQQPMCNEDGTVWVTFNGEIYNYMDIRAQLVALGHQFRTRSDTEVIVHGFEQWGADVVGRLQGIFAFAAHNEATGCLLLARDHFGVKPLVYSLTDGQLLFASEIKALFAGNDLPRQIDNESLVEYFEYGYIPAPRSMFRDVRKLPPGHLMLVDTRLKKEPVLRRYWRLRFDEIDYSIDDKTAAEEIVRLMRESVRSQLVSDVPLGAMLSGGIDSSAIVALMAQLSPTQVQTFSIGFEDERFSETKFARMVAEAKGTNHRELVVTADVEALLPRLIYHFDEPFADASAVPTYYVCEMARRNVTVCMAGDGGDELFAGYDRYARCLRKYPTDWLPSKVRHDALAWLGALYPARWPGAGTVRSLPLSVDERYVEYMRNQYGAVDVRRILAGAARGSAGPQDSFRAMRQAFSSGTAEPLQRILEVDVSTYLANDILVKTDITSMMNSLEVRVPLLDVKLAEYVARLPPDMKLRKQETKYIFKKAMEPLLPRQILYRQKMGFGVPMRRWVATRLRPLVRHYLLESPHRSGMLDGKLLRSMVEDNEANLYGSATGGKLWWVLCFEMWHQDVFRQSGE